MNAGPYSDDKVQKFISDHFVPIKSQVFWDRQSEQMKHFGVKWTPTLVVLDKHGREHHRMVGFVPVDDLLAHLKLGLGKIFYDSDHFRNAIEAFTSLIAEHPDSGSAPEAVFLLGVAEYKKNHDAAALRRAYETLKAKYSGSEWFRRAVPYSQIPE